MRSGWTPVAVLLLGGCAYYNGVYNARSAAHTGDLRFQQGESYAASQSYLISAAKAETSLIRHRTSRWHDEALYLTARGFALGGECGKGLRRIDEFLALPNTSNDDRSRVLIARAVCLLADNQPFAADTVLGPLLTNSNTAIRSQASLWGGRVALALGDAERAQALLAAAPRNAASWEFMDAAFKRGDLATAESLLALHARAGEWRSEVPGRVRTLWGSDHRAAAVRVVNLYGRSSAPSPNRVALHLTTSDLAAEIGDTALAHLQAIEAQRVGITPAVEAETRSRLLALRIRELELLSDVKAAYVRDSARIQGTILQKRIADHLTLIDMFLGGPNEGGAGFFNAAELARDSLRAFRLARTLFLSVERDFPEYQTSARALFAVRSMFPEWTAVYEKRIIEKWPDSYAAAALRGGNPDSSTKKNEDGALSRSRQVVMVRWDSTLKARKTADSIAVARGPIRP